MRKGINEKAYDENNKIIIEISKKFFRPQDVVYLLGDSTKAKREMETTKY